jgi:hypothetical protein
MCGERGGQASAWRLFLSPSRLTCSTKEQELKFYS